LLDMLSRMSFSAWHSPAICKYQSSTTDQRSGRLFFLKIIIGYRCQIAGSWERNVRLLCNKWVQMCSACIPFQFPWHETLIMVLTCWSHCCSSSVSSSKCITASTCEPTENIWVNMVQITITYKGKSFTEFFRLQHQIGYFKKKKLV
jgi:hypothetical protein